MTPEARAASSRPALKSPKEYIQSVRGLAAFQTKLDLEERWPCESSICPIKHNGDFGRVCALWIELVNTEEGVVYAY